MAAGARSVSDTELLASDAMTDLIEETARRYPDRIIIFDSPPLTYSGDVQMRALGWIREMNKPMWSIKSDEPLAFTLLSAVAEIKLKE